MPNLDPLHSEKWFTAHFQERVDALLTDTQLLRVWKKFGGEVFRRSSVLECLDSFVRNSGFRGSHCVEIGTCNGLTAIVLARYFEQVTTIDVAPNDVKREIASFLKVKNINFIDVADNTEKAAVIKALPAFDGAFVDGDHARDTETDFALVRGCRQVLMHEHWEPQPPVMHLVSRLRANGHEVRTEGKWAMWKVGA